MVSYEFYGLSNLMINSLVFLIQSIFSPMPGTPEFDILCPHGAGMTHNGDGKFLCFYYA